MNTFTNHFLQHVNMNDKTISLMCIYMQEHNSGDPLLSNSNENQNSYNVSSCTVQMVCMWQLTVHRNKALNRQILLYSESAEPGHVS